MYRNEIPGAYAKENIEIVREGESYSFMDHYLLADHDENALKWIDKRDGTIILWVRESAFSLTDLAQLMSMNSPVRPTTKTRRATLYSSCISDDDSEVEKRVIRPQVISKHDMDDRRENPQPERKREEREQTPEEIMRKVKFLNKICLAELTEADFLGSHLNRINDLLISYDLMRNGKVPLQLNDELCNKFLKSVDKIAKVHTTSQNIIRQQGADWVTLVNILKKMFCSQLAITDSYKRRLSNLRFMHASKADEFVIELSTIYSLFCELYGKDNELELVGLKNEILSKLAEWLRRAVIRKMAEHSKGGETWHNSVPFLQRSGLGDTDVSFCGFIENECLIARHSFYLDNRQAPKTDTRSDRVLRVATTSESETRWYLKGDRVPTSEELTRLGFDNISKASANEKCQWIYANLSTDLVGVKEKLSREWPSLFVGRAFGTRPKNL